MTKIVYVKRKFSASSLVIIKRANVIIAEYEEQGFALTLRQLYYQFVARGFIANKLQEYKRLGSIINDARLAGLIDWEAIEDRTRNLESLSTWSSPQALVKAAAEQYRRDLWADQEVRPEVWIEKDALTGVIEPVCEELRVAYFACRGYSSQSEQWRASQRFAKRAKDGQRTVIIHLGDHDPSGLDMTRDNRERLNSFVARHVDSVVKVERVALNMSQVEQYGPPPNPAKMTDSRAEDYVAEFGHSSWELDALDPPVIARLIRVAVNRYRDPKVWKAALARETAERSRLEDVVNNWDGISDYLDTL